MNFTVNFFLRGEVLAFHMEEERLHILSERVRPLTRRMLKLKFILRVGSIFLLGIMVGTLSSLGTETSETKPVMIRLISNNAGEPQNPPKVLILIMTGPAFYETRVKQIRDTWAFRVNQKSSMKLFFVTSNDKNATNDMWSTKCVDGYFMASCKIAEALERSYDLLQAEADFEWIFYADDDIYLLPDNLQHLILRLGPRAPEEMKVYGLPGCFDRECGGFCGGGGALFHRNILKKVVLDRNKKLFPTLLSEFEYISQECGLFHDICLGRLVEKHRNLTIQEYPLTPFVWDFDSSIELEQSFIRKDPLPWLYHYPSWDKMYYIHIMTERHGSNIKITSDEIH
jgi:hypothetical protein